MQNIFFIGTVVFALAAGYFSVFRRRDFNTAFLVSGTTLLSYLLMYSNLLSFEVTGGEIVHWTRWVAYALSCSLLMYSITKKLNFSRPRMSSTLGLNVLVMLSGALAAVLEGWPMLASFALGGYAYLLMTYPILRHEEATTGLKAIILGGWGVFPIVFLLAPEGFGIISGVTAAILYLGLDILTKIVYYLAPVFKGERT